MSSLHSTNKNSYRGNLKSKRGAEEGRLYENLLLVFLAERGYELLKHNNSEICEFSISREVHIGKDNKLDDVVFSYIDQNKTKKLIFVQVKHKLDDDLIDSEVLSAEAATARNAGGSRGGTCRDFNLQKYFISYLSARDELQSATSKELIGGKIKYVALYTNIGLNIKELNENGFGLKEAPEDVVNLFTLNESSETQPSNHCYQFENVSGGVREILKKSSDLDRLARELAQFAVWKNYREKKTMGIDEAPMKHYHVALEREVILRSHQTKDKSPGMQLKNEPYCEARFRDDFLDSDEPSSKQKLRTALFAAIRELDKSKKDASDVELKKYLREAKWKVVSNFGKNKQNTTTELPREWITVKDEDITEFLKCFVFIVEQPRVAELETLYTRSIQGAVVENAPLKQFLDQIYDTGPEFRNDVEKVLGPDHNKTNTKQIWISGDEIETFIESRKQLVSVTYVVNAMTLMNDYKKEVLQYGRFNDLEKIIDDVDSFLTSKCKILYVNTPVTLLSSIKILQHLNTEKDYNAESNRIFVNLDILNCAKNRDSVLKAFELGTNSLLTIECRHAFKDQDVEQFFFELLNIAKNNYDKKLIFITQPNNVIFTEDIKTDFEDKKLSVIVNDSIDLKSFEPQADPLVKDVLVFHGQKEKISLSDLTGIDSWSSYVNSLSVETSGQGIIDGMTLLEILSNHAIEVGSKPPGTSSLEGAYAKMYEEINVGILINKLKSQEHANNSNDIYVISGIRGSEKKDKTEKLIQHLGLSENKGQIQEQLGDIGSDKKIQIADDQFQDEGFRSLCHNFPEKRIFWICAQWENNVTEFILQEIYNPQFYLKRKFENVIIKKALKEYLVTKDLSETFIFHCAEDKQELYKSMELNECEIEQFEVNCKVKVFSLKSDAEAVFKELSKQKQTVHFLDFEEKQVVWCDSHGSVKSLQKYIDQKQSQISLVDEDDLIRKIKDRKVVILADDPGMGKTTTLVKLYETENESSSIKNSHWIIVIKLKKHLQVIRDFELKIDGIDIASVVEFLSIMDLKLNNKLAKNLLAMALDKSKNFAKSLLLVFDGFDEVLDEDDRNRILLLLKFIKNETAAKLWITSRLHFKASLDKELSTIAIEFVPMDRRQKVEYITKYLQQRLYLILNEKIFNGLFNGCNERQESKNILVYTETFLNKVEFIFKGNISRFIGTPLQLRLMLDGSEVNFKNWIEKGDGKIPVFDYVGSDVCKIFENFIDRKYAIYIQKIGIRDRVLQKREKNKIHQDHKDFAESKILGVNPSNAFEEFKNLSLLAGLIKSQGSNLEFIHQTFEEFFAAEVFIDWMVKVPKTNSQEYLLKYIFKKRDYRLIRTFINRRLQKMTEKARKGKRQYDESYGNIAVKLLKEKKKPFIDNYGTPLHIAVEEGNKAIACFLLNILKGQPNVLKEFLFFPDKSQRTALHLACRGNDVEIVKALLDAAADISEDTLQEFLNHLEVVYGNALGVAVMFSHNFPILKELLKRANSKLDLVLTSKSSERYDTVVELEKFLDHLLKEFKEQNEVLEKLLFFFFRPPNVLFDAASYSTIDEKLSSVAKSMKNKKPYSDYLYLITALRASLLCMETLESISF